jgi:hypothetical protein
MTTARENDFEIALGFRASRWRALNLDPRKLTGEWSEAVKAFEDRIAVRFLRPVDELVRWEEEQRTKTFGFAILAIDCLVIETLQAFREGVTNHRKKSGPLFTAFLEGWDAFRECVPRDANLTSLAYRFYGDCRCALLHSGSTEGDLIVAISGPMVVFRSGHVVRINRKEFHAKLKAAFVGYVNELLIDANVSLRKRFKMKMDAICRAQRRSEAGAHLTRKVQDVSRPLAAG